MPPANASAATAIAVTTFPYTNTQSDIADAGVYWDAWYKITAPTDAKMISVWGYSDNIPGGLGYIVQSTAYSDVIGTEYPATPAINSRTNLPIQIHVTTPAQEFWIAFRHVFGAYAGLPSDILTVNIAIHDPTDITEGDFFVNNDVGGLNYPSAILSHTANYIVKDYWTDVTSAGEGGDILPSGIFAVNDTTTDTVRLHAADRSIIATTSALANAVVIRRDSTGTQFWLRYKTTPFGNAFIRTLSSTGVLGSEIELVGASIGNAFGVDGTNNIAYIGGSFGEAISRWDLDTSTLLSDFAPNITDYEGEDLFILSDGTVVVIYLETNLQETHVVHYSAAGAVLNNFNLGTSEITVPRGAWALDNPNSIWVMDHQNSETSFKNIRLSDGSVLTTRFHALYDRGQYGGLFTTIPHLYGQANSCPFFLLVGDAVPEGGGNGNGNGNGEEEVPPLTHPGGVYYVPIPTPPANGTPPSPPTIPPGGPDTHHDSYNSSETRKIPNPTIRTALLGE